MSDAIEPLILDMLEWVTSRRRTYAQVLSVWRTSCPRLSVWEEANDRGYINVRRLRGTTTVLVSPRGLRHLRAQRPRVPAAAPPLSVPYTRFPEHESQR